MELALQIVNEKGLHARASAKFVEVVENFDATAIVSKDGLNVTGDSMMGLMMLAASQNTYIKVVTSGLEAEKLGFALKDLVTNYFDEGR